MPSPPSERSLAEPIWANISKIFGMDSGLTPIPLSATLMTTWSASQSAFSEFSLRVGVLGRIGQ